MRQTLCVHQDRHYVYIKTDIKTEIKTEGWILRDGFYEMDLTRMILRDNPMRGIKNKNKQTNKQKTDTSIADTIIAETSIADTIIADTSIADIQA